MALKKIFLHFNFIFSVSYPDMLCSFLSVICLAASATVRAVLLQKLLTSQY